MDRHTGVPVTDLGVILESCRRKFDVAVDAEVTIEANPNGVTEEYLDGLLEIGVNRLSVGAQTFDRRGLRVLGRQHESADTTSCVVNARAAGFRNISLDLIFGWPDQTEEIWQQDLDIALDLEPDHLSLYSLIVEPGTPMAEAVTRNVLVPIDDDAAADLYELAIATLGARQWIHYEIANWAQSAGFESRHNRVYWRNGVYAAYGAGAHGRLGETRYMNHLAPRHYIDAVAINSSAISNSELIDERTSMGETMMLGLRLLREGVSYAEFEGRHGVKLQDQFGEEIDALVESELVTVFDGRVTLTRKGTLLANEVCSRFV